MATGPVPKKLRSPIPMHRARRLVRKGDSALIVAQGRAESSHYKLPYGAKCWLCCDSSSTDPYLFIKLPVTLGAGVARKVVDEAIRATVREPSLLAASEIMILAGEAKKRIAALKPTEFSQLVIPTGFPNLGEARKRKKGKRISASKKGKSHSKHAVSKRAHALIRYLYLKRWPGKSPDIRLKRTEVEYNRQGEVEKCEIGWPRLAGERLRVAATTEKWSKVH